MCQTGICRETAGRVLTEIQKQRTAQADWNSEAGQSFFCSCFCAAFEIVPVHLAVQILCGFLLALSKDMGYNGKRCVLRQVAAKKIGGPKMKRCIICGNVGSDDSTVCEVCGNPYLDIQESEYSDLDVDYGREEELPTEEMTGASEYTEEKTQPEEDRGTDPEETHETKPEETYESESEETHETKPAEARETKLEEAHGTKSEEARETEPKDAVITPEKPAAAEVQMPRRQAAPLRGEPHIYGQSDANRGGERRTSGAIRREMGRAYEGSRADAPVKGAARPADVKKPEEMQQRTGRPVGRNAAEGAQRPQGIREGQAQGRPQMQGTPMQGNPMQERPLGANGAPMMGAAGRSSMPMRPLPPQNQSGNAANRPAGGAYGNGARPVNYMAQRIAAAARKQLKSPLFLLIVLLQTIYLAGTVASVYLQQVDFSQIARLLADTSVPGQAAGYVNGALSVITKLDGMAGVIQLIISFPDLLLCIGLWLTWFAARTKKEKMSCAGLNFWKIYVVIGMIGTCLMMLVGLVVGVALVVSAWASGSKGVIAVTVILLILLIVVTMMVVMYYFSFLATLKTFRRNGNGESYGAASGYVGMIHILLGLFGIIGLLSGIVNEEIGTILSSAGKIGWMVLFGLWIFHYRSKLSEVEGE